MDRASTSRIAAVVAARTERPLRRGPRLAQIAKALERHSRIQRVIEAQRRHKLRRG